LRIFRLFRQFGEVRRGADVNHADRRVLALGSFQLSPSASLDRHMRGFPNIACDEAMQRMEPSNAQRSFAHGKLAHSPD
jgi:hypothetical protein